MSELKKCLVWDLDNTLWDGICLEGEVTVKQEVYHTLIELDRRGILHSVASRGDEELAMSVLKVNKLDELFIAPQINWLPKSQSIMRISKELGFSLNSIAFIDDDEFEREQIKYMLPDVLTIDACKAKELREYPEFLPEKITSEAGNRRDFYRAEMNRKKMSLNYNSREDFLKSCEMKLNIRQMNNDDIPRVLELMTRTHQLNTTGLILGQEELQEILYKNENGLNVMVAELEDKFGKYGIIGTAITETKNPLWILKYLALSCRVMGRGIERALMAHIIRQSFQNAFTKWEAEFRNSGRNKMMRILYQMMGFKVHRELKITGTLIFKANLDKVPEIPKWVEII